MSLLRLLLIPTLLGMAWLLAGELRDRHASGRLELDIEPLAAARDSLERGLAEEAALLARFARDTTTDPGAIRAADRILEQASTPRPWSERLRRFAHGAATGEPRDLDGFLGSLSLDLFVVGDIRDIVVQGYREATGGDGDLVILGLSAAGLATTLSPQFHLAPAMLKTFRRAGALSERFVKSLRRLSRSALRSGDFKALDRVTRDFAVAGRRLGPAPFARIARHIDDPADLARVARAAEVDAAATYGLVRLSDGRAVKLLDAGNGVSTLARTVRRGARGGKLLVKAVHSVPDVWLATALLALLSAAALTTAGAVADLVRRLRPRSAPVLRDAVSRA